MRKVCATVLEDAGKCQKEPAQLRRENTKTAKSTRKTTASDATSPSMLAAGPTSRVDLSVQTMDSHALMTLAMERDIAPMTWSLAA